MDDPTKTQGELQDTTGQTSEGAKEGTSQQKTPETLTREQHLKILSDEKAQMGRELKAARAEAERFKTAQSKVETELTETRNQLKVIQDRIDEAEAEEAKGSPESLKLYQRQKQLRDQERKLQDDRTQLEKDKTEHADDVRMVKEAKVEMTIISAAIDAHVDIGKLKEKCEKLNLTTEEQISEMAQTLAGQAKAEGYKETKIPKGDSGQTIGGAVDSLKARYPSMYQK